VWLCNLIKDVKNVDTKIYDLSSEVTRLTDLLTSVEHTVRECQGISLTLAHLDEHMWQQIDNALVDCKVTVEELDRITMRISGEYNTDTKSVAKLLKKPSMHFRFTVHGDEVSDLTKKIYKSNCSMQTALAVVNVSITFRTQVSQESLFNELRNLKALVETSLKVAKEQQVASTDPFADRQSRNLESLAKAAKKFHMDASTTASTRYSTTSWGHRSEGGGLTAAQRERIEQWNSDLQTVDETTEDSMSDNVMSLPTDSHTTITTITIPDADDLPSDGGKGKERDKRVNTEPEKAGKGEVDKEADQDDDDDDTTESDVELDFLKNFEELAYARFMAQDYGKAEQFLRMAVERSTGDVSGTASFKMLKLKLALSCCLQEKWDHAAGIIASMSKARSAANLPVFHLLQAISLAHLEGGRFDEAYMVCKTALQGKKKILGKTSSDYYECLTVFAAICDKKGDTLEGEAVRHSIPRDWFPRSRIAMLAPKQYILRHETLVDSVFSGGLDNNTLALPSQPGSPATPRSDNANNMDSTIWEWALPIQSAETPPGQESSASAVESSKPRTPVVDHLGLHQAGGETDHQHRRLRSAEEFPVVDPPTNNPFLRKTSNPFPHKSTNPFLNKSLSVSARPNPPTQTASLPTYPSQMPSPPDPDRAPPPPPPLPPPAHSQPLTLEPPETANPGPPLYTESRQRPPIIEHTESEPSGNRHPPMPQIRVQDAEHSERQEHSWEHPWDKPSLATYTTTRNLSMSPKSDIVRSLSHSSGTGRPRLPQQRNPDLYRSSSTSVHRPPSNQALIEQVQKAAAPKPPINPVQNDPSRQRFGGIWDNTKAHKTNDLFIEDMDSSKPGGEYVSTLEVATSSLPTPASSDARSPSPNNPQAKGHIRKVSASRESPLHIHLPRVRWIPQKDISNVGGARPFGNNAPPHFLPTGAAVAAATTGCAVEHYSVGIEGRLWGSDVFALSRGSGQISLCNVPDLIRRMKSSAGRVGGGGGLHGDLTDASLQSSTTMSPRLWRKDATTSSRERPHLLRELGLLHANSNSFQIAMAEQLRRIELEIASTILWPHTPTNTIPSQSAVTSLRINAVVCALPDVLLDPQMWPISSSSLADCPLIQHAKVIPHSFAIMQYFLHSGALSFQSSLPDNEPTSSDVIVLSCHDTLVECTSYVIQQVSSEYIEVSDSDSLYMAEVAGAALVQAKFAKLVTNPVKLMNNQFRHKMEQNQVDRIIKSCCDHFRRLVFPGFCNDGRDWEVNYEALQPDTTLTVLHGRLKFSNDDILACFEPSVMVLRKMISESVGRIRNLHDGLPSHVLMAGTYANSSYLTATIRDALEDCRFANERGVSLLQAPEGEDVCALGALYHAKSC
ncbi:hypothetical protein B0H63DRAFT_405141, partial [Podospora didyma]